MTTSSADATGTWQVEFAPAAAGLLARHTPSGATVSGTLAFQTDDLTPPETWTVAAPRDPYADRPALLNPRGEAQGYLLLHTAGNRLEIRAIHRGRQNYHGTLRFTGTVHLGHDTFACQTHRPANADVVQMASGPADSDLNDSLFDITTDTALVMLAASTRIRTQPQPHDGATAFDVELSALVHDPRRAALVFELHPSYYADTYVPAYRPLDHARCPRPATGWMSWNVYFDTAGEDENLAEARVGAAKLKPFGMEYWSIESWQDNSPKLPVSNFHCLTLRPYAAQFPHGMKWLAGEIRRLGFRPGIWTVPFGTGDDAFHDAHPTWFLHDSAGKPLSNWCGRYVLDPTVPEARAHMETMMRTMAEDWGYEFFKVDGMSGHASHYSAHFFELPHVRTAMQNPAEANTAYAECIAALRRGIGPARVFLACQAHYTGPEAGIVDAGRIGSDIVYPNHPPTWEGYKHQATMTLNQLFVHSIVWYNDPDTLMVGETAPLNVARIAATVVGLPGQVMFAGDKLAELPAERMRLLQQTLPPCPVRPLNLEPIFDLASVWDLKVNRPFAQWDVVSVFNWTDSAVEKTVNFADLGLEADTEYAVYDFWNQTYLGRKAGNLALSLAPRSNALLSIHRAAPHPQWLSTDRHLSQGAVSLKALAWNDTDGVLEGEVELVANHPTRLTFACPPPYAPTDATATTGIDAHLTPHRPNDAVCVMSLASAASGPAHFRVRFTRQ